MIFAIVGVLIILFFIAQTGSATSTSEVDMSTIVAIYAQWWDLADNWAQAVGNLSKEEILAIITNESSGNPTAFNPGDPSYGLMGVSELIGKAYGGITNVTDLYNPATNVKSGASFMSYLKHKYQTVYPLDGSSGWIQAYNEGETAFLNGKRAIGYEQAFTLHVQQFLDYENSQNG